MKVTYKFVGDDDTAEFLLGNKALEDGKIDVFSPESPLGAAILGAKVGDQVSYTAPTGKTLKVEVVEAKPYKRLTGRRVVSRLRPWRPSHLNHR